MNAPLTFSAKTGQHAPRMRCSVFRSETGRWVLKMTAANGCGGAAEFDTQEQAFAGMRELHAELTTARPLMRGMAADRREVVL